MIRATLFTLLLSTVPTIIFGQIQCVFCYDQTAAISPTVTNFMLNGGFENNTCNPGQHFCPNSASYSCDINDWTVTGGGSSTYAQVFNNSFCVIPEGLEAVYLGNYFADPCPTPGDTSCYDIQSDDCTVINLPAGYPTNTASYGGNTGVSIEQTVTGLTVGQLYVLEFWAGGEWSFIDIGFFGLDVGFGDLLLTCSQTPANQGFTGTRYLVEFLATSTTHTIKFTNWGHVCSTCSEVVIDDVILYAYSDPNNQAPDCGGVPPPPPPPGPGPNPVPTDESLHIPNIFTPNDDQANDIYEIMYAGNQSYDLKIVNRWGNVMFESDDKTKHWDGTVDGKEASEGTYFYNLKIGDQVYSGFLQLVR